LIWYATPNSRLTCVHSLRKNPRQHWIELGFRGKGLDQRTVAVARVGGDSSADAEKISFLLEEIKNIAAAQGGIQLVRAKRNFDFNARGVCGYANPFDGT
jgi:hypothetical protein